ncbi:DinB family protein [Oerskovia flava]|uniref:DinB family protein n=1 Tax=Oerskovia flava TaxID=2986422 RepID=UPI00223EB977|nr:DinB family protein [Oerskovia sp. JB1-3-2]
MDDAKATLHHYLQAARDALLWKLEGLDERAARWPRTPTGTNLLGLVKHAASIEIGYFGDVFGRSWPTPEEVPWIAEDADDNADMWATADEPTAWVVDLYRRVWTFADAAITELDLDAVGRVPWWPTDRNEVTLLRVVTHVTSDLTRHAGHADILRELIDGHAGLRPDSTNLPDMTAEAQAAYVQRLQDVADAAGS